MHPRHRRAASLESGELSRVMRQPLRYTRWCRFVRVRSFISSHGCCCSGSSSDNKDRICLIAPYNNPTINRDSLTRIVRLFSSSPLHEPNLLGFTFLRAFFTLRQGAGKGKRFNRSQRLVNDDGFVDSYLGAIERITRSSMRGSKRAARLLLRDACITAACTFRLYSRIPLTPTRVLN